MATYNELIIDHATTQLKITNLGILLRRIKDEDKRKQIKIRIKNLTINLTTTQHEICRILDAQ